MKRFFLLFMMATSLLVLSGCWGRKEIESQIYISGIGIDYIEGEFIVHLQALNFADIAKQEGAPSLQKSIPVFIGEAKGKTIQAAISKIEQNAAYPLYFGHDEAVLLSENVINEKLDSIIEFIGQDIYMRYNSNFFGTVQDIKEMFNSESFLNYSSLYTVIHKPNELIKNNFILPVQRYNKFISTFYQPVGTFIIPTLGINQSYFSEGKEKKQIASITGGFVISNQEYKGWIDKNDLSGLKWTSDEASVIPLTLYDEKVSVLIIRPSKTIKVIKGSKPSYEIMVRARAVLTQNEENMGLENIEKELNKVIKNDIKKTLEIGDEVNADLLNISEKAYRYHLREWDVAEIKTFDVNSIGNIDVKIKIEKASNYKK